MNFKLQIRGTQPQQKKKIFLVLTYIDLKKLTLLACRCLWFEPKFFFFVFNFTIATTQALQMYYFF